jgi:hypothetical protein
MRSLATVLWKLERGRRMERLQQLQVPEEPHQTLLRLSKVRLHRGGGWSLPQTAEPPHL